MWVSLLLALAVPGGIVTQHRQLKDILDRVAEEAEVFRQMAPDVLSEETLTQRALKHRSRFRPRIGAAAVFKPHYQTRRIVSEYSFSTLPSSPNMLHEFRQVVSVDGHTLTTPVKARHSLSLGIRSQDERLKKRMLEDFQKHGLIGAATDFGQSILLFTKREIGNFQFQITGETQVGSTPALALSYRQKAGHQELLIFEGRRAIHEPLQGQLFVRKSDGLPLRITMEATHQEGKHTIKDHAIVDYNLSSFGVLLPASVTHQEFNDDNLTVENLFHYAPFKRFGADTEIKFTQLPEPGK